MSWPFVDIAVTCPKTSCYRQMTQQFWGPTPTPSLLKRLSGHQRDQEYANHSAALGMCAPQQIAGCAIADPAHSVRSVTLATSMLVREKPLYERSLSLQGGFHPHEPEGQFRSEEVNSAVNMLR